MDNRDDAIFDQALAWHQSLSGDDADWDGFTAWLEGGEAHRRAYDEVSLLDADLDTHRDQLRAILPTEATPQPRRLAARWLAGGGLAAAAALAVVLALPGTTNGDIAPIVYASQPGATRAVTLEDGSQIALSADSRVAVTRTANRIELQQGAAFFDVPHDPTRQLTIVAGDYRITDIGTRFSVDRASDQVSVAVAEGNVTVLPPVGASVTLAAGERLVGDGNGAPVVTPAAPAAIASWRSGRLMYDGTPLTKVAEDIRRYTGSRLDIDEAVRHRRFSGVLVIGDGSHLVTDLAALAGLSVDQRGDHLVLGAGRH